MQLNRIILLSFVAVVYAQQAFANWDVIYPSGSGCPCESCKPPPPPPPPCHKPPPPPPPPATTAPPPTPKPTTPKPKIFINEQPPIIIDRKAQSYVVKASAPIVVKPAPVVIHRPGSVESRPVVINVTPKPIVVTKKIVKVERPIVKKYYVEQYSKTEPCACNDVVHEQPPHIPPGCGCK